MASILGSERSPGEENGNTLQNSCQGNSIDRGAWQAIVHGVSKESDMTEHACTHMHTHKHKYSSDYCYQSYHTLMDHKFLT